MNEKITIALDSLNLTELVTFCERLLDIFSQAEIDEAKQHHLVVKFKSKTEQCRDALTKARTASMGPEIAEADKRRDLLYSGLKKSLESMLPFGGDKATAAKKLLKIFDEYPGAPSLNYSQQTQAMNYIVREFNEPAAKALIELAGVEDQVDMFKDSQAAFLKLFSDRQNIDSDLDRIPSASKVKPELIGMCRDIFNLLWIMHELDGWNEIYLDVLREVKTEKASGRIPSSGKTTTEEE